MRDMTDSSLTKIIEAENYYQKMLQAEKDKVEEELKIFRAEYEQKLRSFQELLEKRLNEKRILLTNQHQERLLNQIYYLEKLIQLLNSIDESVFLHILKKHFYRILPL